MATPVDEPMASRTPVPDTTIRIALEDKETKGAAALVYNLNEFADLPSDFDDYLTIQTLSRAYFLLEFHNGGPAGSDRLIRRFKYPLTADDNTTVLSEADQRRQAKEAVDLLRERLPYVPVHSYTDWLYHRRWIATGWLAQEAAKKVVAGELSEPSKRQTIVDPPTTTGDLVEANTPGAVVKYNPQELQLRPEEIGFFDPDYPLAPGEGKLDTGRQGKDLVFRDVHLLWMRVQDVINARGVKAVRTAMPSVFKGSAQYWYTAMLNDDQKRVLRNDPSDDLQLWKAELMRYFRPPPGAAFQEMLTCGYTTQDVANGMHPHAYVARKSAFARSAGLEDSAIMHFLYTGVQPELRAMLPPLTNLYTPDALVLAMTSRYDTWVELYKNASRQSSFRSDNRPFSQKPQSSSFRPPGSGLFANQQRGSLDSTTKFQRKQLPASPQKPYETKASRANFRNKPPKPCWTCQGPHWNAECPQNPAAAKGVYVAEVVGDQEYDDEHAVYVNYVYGSLADQSAKWDPEQLQTFEELYEPCEDPSAHFVTEIGSPLSEAHDDVEPPDCFSARVIDADDDAELLEVPCDQHPSGLSYRRYQHARMPAAFQRHGRTILITPDSGSSISLVDRTILMQILATLENPKPQVQKHVDSFDVNGVGSAANLLCQSYITLRFYIQGSKAEKAAILTFEATLHIVDHLKPNILLGNDVLVPLKAVLDYSDATFCITELQFRTTFNVLRQPAQKTQRLKVAYDVELAPNAISYVPFAGCIANTSDFIFTPEPLGVPSSISLSTHVVDKDTSFVLATNWSNETVILDRDTIIGSVTPMKDEEMAPILRHYHPLAERGLEEDDHRFRLHHEEEFNGTLEEVEEMLPGMETSTTLSDDEVLAALDVHPDAESIREALRPFVSLWQHQDGIIQMPEENYLQIPLMQGWEEKLKVAQAVYRLSPEDRALVDKVFDGLHAEGKMKWCRGAPFGWPVFVVWRGKGAARKGRVVVDVRGLNAISVPDVYPLPHRDDLIQAVFGCSFLTSVDMTASFYQFPVNPDHTNRLSVITHRGHETFLVAMMGYMNSVAHVQRFGEQEFRDYLDFLKIYVDDWLVHSHSLDEHLGHLRRIFSRMIELKVSLSLKKTHIGYPSLNHLGCLVDRYGLTTAEEKVAAIKDLTFPRTLKDLEIYLGFTGYLRHFVPYYAALAAPLQQRKVAMLKAYRPHSDGSNAKEMKTVCSRLQATRFEPSLLEVAAFEELQRYLSSPRSLAHHDVSIPLLVDIDASKERGYGIMLYHLALRDDADEKSLSFLTKDQQLQANPDELLGRPQAEVRPVLFLSKELTQAESRYHATELEVSAFVFQVRKTRHLVEAAARVVVFTDHAATPAIFNQVSLKSTSTDRLNMRLIRAAQYLSQFRHKLTVFYKPGRLHKVPDALLRLQQLKAPETTDVRVIPKKKEEKPEEEFAGVCVTEMHVQYDQLFLKRFYDAYKKDKQWKAYYPDTEEPADSNDSPTLYYQDAGLVLYKDSKTRLLMARMPGVTQDRIVVPKSMLHTVFDLAHDWCGHVGFHRIYNQIVRSFFVSHLSRRLRQYIAHCPNCQVTQTSRLAPAGVLNPIPAPITPYATICIDIFGGLPEHPVTGNDSVLSCSDKCSKEQAFLPGRNDYGAADWAKIIWNELVLKRRWGLPNVIMSDRDPRFTSELWRTLFTLSGVKLAMTTAYHPQGHAERSNQTAEIALRFYLSSIHMVDDDETLEDKDWEAFLLIFEAVCNNSVNDATGQSPNMIIRGFTQRMGLDLLAKPTGSDSTEAETFLFKREIARQDARDSIAFANYRMKKHADLKKRNLEFQKGDKVYLHIHKGYALPSDKVLKRKFNVQRVGPYQILEKVGNAAYRLDIPAHQKIHPVIGIAQLSPHPSEIDPYGRPRHVNPIVTADGNEVEIEQIMGRRMRKIGQGEKGRSVVEYLIKWKDYGPEHDQWIPGEDLNNARDLVAEFNEKERLRSSLRTHVRSHNAPPSPARRSPSTPLSTPTSPLTPLPQSLRPSPQPATMAPPFPQPVPVAPLPPAPPGLLNPPGRPSKDPHEQRRRAIEYTMRKKSNWHPQQGTD